MPPVFQNPSGLESLISGWVICTAVVELICILGQFNLQFVLLIDISYCHHHCMIVVTSTQDTTETNILSYLIVVCRYIL